ncbi:MAG: VOC family protein [bacterium]|nr:VOC family protein [bacterium]
MAAVNPIPDGFHTISPHIVCQGAAEAIEFYKKAFGAEEVFRMPGPDGKAVMHAELQIGDSRLMLCEEFPDMGAKSPKAIGGTPVTVHLYVADADKIFAQAIEAGATVNMPLTDMFWGDRYGKLSDPFGHQWSVATHKEDLSPDEIAKRQAEAFGPGGKCGG